MLTSLKVAFSYVKKYWWIAAAIVGFVLFKRWMDQSGDIAKTLEDIQKAHDEELKSIKDADAARSKATQDNIQKMQDRLDAVEKQYEAAQQQLDDSKREQIKQILATDSNDPDALSQKLSDATGFKIILPS